MSFTQSVANRLRGITKSNIGVYPHPVAVASANDLDLSNIEAGLVEVSGTTTVNGIKWSNPTDGQMLVIRPTGAFTVANNASPSTGYSKIYLAGGANRTLVADKTALILFYDSTNDRWVEAGSATTGVASTSAGVRVVAGEVALDGSNPTDVATGLTTITGAVITLKSTSAPGVGTSSFTYGSSGGTLSIYAWKVTSSGDTTLIASTGTETVGYVVFGT